MDDTIYFWSAKDASTGYLSQWYYSPFQDAEGNHFINTETFMMYRKAILFKDTENAKKILKCGNPRQVKEYGRLVVGFDEKIWKKFRETIVYQANLLKFQQNEELKEMLLRTGNRPIVEASPYDAIWGVGFDIEVAENNRKYWGLNLLGKALEKVRKRLSVRQEQ